MFECTKYGSRRKPWRYWWHQHAPASNKRKSTAQKSTANIRAGHYSRQQMRAAHARAGPDAYTPPYAAFTAAASSRETHTYTLLMRSEWGFERGVNGVKIAP